jgi:DNA-binding PadR family transcriptional regulator
VVHVEADLDPSIQERIIKAFSDLAILCALTNGALTGYEINRFFVKEFGILVGPSIIYSKLSVMERKEWIQSTRTRTARTYKLTDQGQEIVCNMSDIIEESQKFTKKLLRTKVVLLKENRIQTQ